MTKELKIDLDYLASTFGLDVLDHAEVRVGEDGGFVLVLTGDKRGK